jgi:hypothetical protein
MKRSGKVAAPLLASAALAMTMGCRKPEMQRCIDQQNAIVDDDLCQSDAAATTPYRYYYGGNGDYEIGSLVAGGSFTPSPGHSYSTKRGGFGSSFPIGEVLLVTGFVGVAMAAGG